MEKKAEEYKNKNTKITSAKSEPNVFRDFALDLIKEYLSFNKLGIWEFDENSFPFKTIINYLLI